MARRITLEVFLILVLTILLAWVVIGAVSVPGSADAVGAFVDQAPRVLLGTLGVALALWAVLLVIGAIANRRRAAGWRIATHLLSLLVAIGLNVGLLALLTVATGGGGADGWGLVVVAIAGATGAALFGAALIVVLVVELVILPAAAPIPAPEVHEAAVTQPENR